MAKSATLLWLDEDSAVTSCTKNTHVALLVAGLALNSQGRAIRLDMTNASARKALLMSEGAGQRAGRRFVT